ncbi:glycerate kinase [Bogoriella caseilytica]|uniref:Glycerate kinase n=1 Tax=Bogoriella caseilytica TaxID=56055 RepID=A0A3N2B967_9MICO|nr:glycerate kinase [Bogoriella caseilytica]ROR71790.1 glycerate kinase [Bogoriella caseilytica]
MRVLLAPDRFSGTLDAVQAARALAEGWRQTAPQDEISVAAMSDGAAGLLDAVHAAVGGELIPVRASGPLGEQTAAAVLHVAPTAPQDGAGTAYVEAGQVLGTQLLEEAQRREAFDHGSSACLASLLEAALDTGASRLVIGLPAMSSVHDGGRGLLEAWGGLTQARERLAGRDVVLALADDIPLLGLHGAGVASGELSVIGPERAQQRERELASWAADREREAQHVSTRRHLLGSPVPGVPGERLATSAGTGAGGGVAFALRLAGARALPGADVVAAAVELRRLVEGSDLVLTGGAVLDVRALADSVTATVARTALPLAIPVVVLAEELHTSRREIAPLGIAGAYEVQERRRSGPSPAEGPGRAGADPRGALSERAARLARTWSH